MKYTFMTSFLYKLADTTTISPCTPTTTAANPSTTRVEVSVKCALSNPGLAPCAAASVTTSFALPAAATHCPPV